MAKANCACALILAWLACACMPAIEQEPGQAALPLESNYVIRVARLHPLRLDISATLPDPGEQLAMSTTRPGGIPALDAGGWPALVSRLRALDARGGEIGLLSLGEEGWKLARAAGGPLTLRYAIDYAPLSALGWPAANESGYADDANIVLAGRSLFITSARQGNSRVVLEAPQGWHEAAPWPRARDGKLGFEAASTDDLLDNLFVFARQRPETIEADGFVVTMAALGHWRSARDEVRAVVGPIARQYARLLPLQDASPYLMVLMPQSARGGESFRNSFAMTVDEAPTRANRARWGNTLAHELFHYWNGWRLRGKDYAATQWFQEGFTEYVANRAMLAAGLTTPDEFLQKLSTHVANYRRLESTLEAPGTRKGPPLYSGGALTALCWDLRILEESHGRRRLDDMLATLWQHTHQGAREYDWRDIHAALAATQAHDWAMFHQRYIAGREPLPVAPALARAGLRLVEADQAGGAPQILRDPGASLEARRLRERVFAP